MEAMELVKVDKSLGKLGKFLRTLEAARSLKIQQLRGLVLKHEHNKFV